MQRGGSYRSSGGSFRGSTIQRGSSIRGGSSYRPPATTYRGSTTRSFQPGRSSGNIGGISGFNRGGTQSRILNGGSRSPIFNRGNSGARTGNRSSSLGSRGIRNSAIRGGTVLRGGSIGGRRGSIGGGRNYAFRNRWSGYGGRYGYGNGGYRGGLRNSWGLFLAGGYGGWGLGFGYGGYGFGTGYGYGGWGLGGWGLGLGLGGYGYGGYGGLGYGGYNPYFGYGYSPPPVDGYYNPYCDAGAAGAQQPFDYSQPIAGSQGMPTDAGVAEMTAADEAFHQGDYKTALANADKAAKAMPNNPNVHQFRSLVLFAMGQYRDAASAAHAALSGGPGWNWQTIRSFYPSKDAYTANLRALEAYRADNPSDLPSRFLLGYHYMMLGHSDAAAAEFVAILNAEPRDKLTAQLLEAISKQTGKQYQTPAAPGTATPAQPNAGGSKLPPPPPLPSEELQKANPTPKANAKVPAINMAGTWTSKSPDGTAFTLTVQGGKFKWTATNAGKVLSIAGNYSMQNGVLQLKPDKGDTLDGKLTVKGNNEFQFKPKWAPADDPGLTFKRQ
jgi:tetratricopeptide (TPR) repeat protein